MNTKICSVCQLSKPIDEFYVRKDRGKPIARCSTCNGLKTKKYRSTMTNEQRRKGWAASAASYAKHAQTGNIRPIIQHKLSGFRGTAKEKNVLFNLDVDFLVDLFNQQKGLCYYTGEKMELTSGLGTTRVSLNNRPYQFSLDRLIPEKGYVKGNVVWCGWLVNTCKNMFNETQFYDFCEKVLTNRLKRVNIRL